MMQAYPASLPSVRSLSLRSTSYEAITLEPCMSPLGSLLPNLTTLQLSRYWDRNHLERLLATTSRSLQTLSLPNCTERIDLSSVLTLFPRLEELRMVSATVLPNAIPRLLSSRVRVLALSGQVQVSLDTLADLIVRAGNSSLDRVHLDLLPDNIPLSRGLELRGYLDDRATVGNVAVLAQQMRERFEPMWTTDLNPTSLTRLLNAAEVTGVRLTGQTATLLNWEDEYEASFEQALVEQAAGKDDYSVLVAYYGRERAMDAVRRCRPGQAQLWKPSS